MPSLKTYLRTDLCIHELSQGSYELWCRIQIVCEKSIVDELADRVPERRLEALWSVSQPSYNAPTDNASPPLSRRPHHQRKPWCSVEVVSSFQASRVTRRVVSSQ